MIDNDSQLALTREMILMFERRLAIKDHPVPEVHERMIQAHRKAVESVLSELHAEVSEYLLRQGKQA